MQKLIRTIACSMAGIMLTGCGRRVITNEADEITDASWSVCEGDISAALSFCGDCAKLSIKSGDEETSIEGLCVIGDSTLIILDESDKYTFDYRLTGSTLTLVSGKDSVTLTKER